MAMGKSTACAKKRDSNEPVLVVGSASVKRKAELSLLQLWDKSSFSASSSADDCTYTAEITSTCGDKSEARKQVCPGKVAPRYLNSSRHLLNADDDDDDSSSAKSKRLRSLLDGYDHADTDTLLSTFPTSVCTRISEAACEGVWRQRVYNAAKQEIGQSLIFVGGESWGIPSDRSIVGDLDSLSVSTLLDAFKVTHSALTILLFLF